MAVVPTPEESGRKVLSIYKMLNVRAGEMLLIQVIKTHWGSDNRDELLSGLEWLGSQDFIEEKAQSSPNAIFLTESGFNAM